MKTRILLACMLLGLGACASQPATDKVADAADKTAKEPKCVKETGTRIKRRDGDRCVGAPGKVYTAEDIERSGAQTIGEILQRGTGAGGGVPR